MIPHAPTNDSPCIVVSAFRPQFEPVAPRSEIQNPGARRDTVKKTMLRNNRAIGVVLVIAGLLLVGNARGQAASQSSPKEQCSLAVVSRSVGSSTPVCDGAVVQQMARSGHAFEQNQLGIASVLAIGPDYSQKEALAWFEKAAQRGYAPAEVNLAVMYANGWGTPVNYGTALHW